MTQDKQKPQPDGQMKGNNGIKEDILSDPYYSQNAHEWQKGVRAREGQPYMLYNCMYLIID